MHSTNYTQTLIAVAPDCPVLVGTPPPDGRPSIAGIIFARLQANPYQFTSDELLFHAHVVRHALPEGEWAAARAAFFGKPRACLRASALGKRYGWGVHFDADGRGALVGRDDPRYAELSDDPSVTVRMALRSKRRRA